MKSGNISSALDVEIVNFLAENPGQKLRPFAYFDKHLDCIRVQIKDCSFKELRLDKVFTVLQANHSTGIKYVGFAIKGVKHLTKNLGLSEDEPVFLAEVIDEIIKQDPSICIDFIQTNFGHILSKKIIVDDFYSKAA